MRNALVGIVVGLVVGIVLGVTILTPELKRQASTATDAEQIVPLNAAPELEVVTPRTSWRMVSLFPSEIPQLGSLAKRFAENITAASDNRFSVSLSEPGEIIEADSILQAVSSGQIEAGFSSPGNWSGANPAFQLFSAIPFGPDASEFIAWLEFGGGKELARELYARENIHPVFCGVIAPEAAGWFRREIRTLDDFQGLRLRFFGLGGQVLSELGAETVELLGHEIYPALEQGEIDGGEYSMPAIDQRLGFQNFASYYYFPGWHQQATMFDLLINLDVWNGLTAADQNLIEAICGDNLRYGLAEGEAIQFDALLALQDEGTRIRRLPPAVLRGLEATWDSLAEELVRADRDFATVWQSLQAFRRNYSIWKELGYLE